MFPNPSLNLEVLAAVQPEVFNAYQQTQRRRVEEMMNRPAYVASFIGHLPGQARFVDMYRVGGVQ